MADLVQSDDQKSAAGPHRWAVVGVCVSVAALLALTLLQYVMPQAAHSIFGLNHAGVRHFQQILLGKTFPGIPEAAFTCWFRGLLAAAWVGYGLAVIGGLQGGTLRLKYVLALTVTVSLLLAVFWPASLSSDVYAYTAFGRMQVLCGLNPYVTASQALRDRGDPAAGFLHWDNPTAYGPGWTLLSVAVVTLLRSSGLWWQVVAMKLVGAAAIVIAALAGRRVAEHYSPRRADLTLLAIGLNPLFLIEGPANGHNDLLMMALLLAAASLLLRKRHLLAMVALGFSVSIKFVTALAVPWAIMEYIRHRRAWSGALSAMTAVLLAGLPTVLCYVPFWEGSALFTGVHGRWAWGLSESGIARDARVTGWLLQHAVPGPVAMLTSFALKHWLLAALFLGLSVWMGWKSGSGKWLTAWIIMSGFIVMAAAGVWFPWYVMWPWAVSLVRWDRLHICLSAACFIFAFALSILYSVAL